MDFPKISNKLAFFDFDRTLVAHSYSREYAAARKDSFMMDCLYSLTALNEEHAADRPLPCMQWYVKKLFDAGYGLFCLTHEQSNLRDELKKEQLKTFYPGMPMTYLTVGEPGHKIDMIKAVAAAECCDLSDIILVDDRMETINEAQALGIDAKHLSDIVVLYEYGNMSEQQDIMIKPKGFADYVKDDPSVMDVILYEEIEAHGSGRVQEGIPDEELERAVRECRQLIEGRKNLQEKIG